MAIEGPQHKIPGLVAGADLSAKQYHFVKMSADNIVIACAAVTDKPIGVLQNKPISGQAAEVCSAGVTKIVGDADLTAGDTIGTSADGQAAAYTVTDTTKHLVGQVIAANTAAGGFITADIDCRASRVLA